MQHAEAQQNGKFSATSKDLSNLGALQMRVGVKKGRRSSDRAARLDLVVHVVAGSSRFARTAGRVPAGCSNLAGGDLVLVHDHPDSLRHPHRVANLGDVQEKQLGR